MLQDDLMAELKELFSNFKLSSPSAEEKEVKIFKQELPFKTKKEEKSQFPYIIVKLVDGNIGTNNTCSVILVLGVFDDSETKQGYKDLLNMMQDICFQYATEKVIAQKYRVEDEIEWSLQEEDTFPYYFGGIALNVTLPKINIYDDCI